MPKYATVQYVNEQVGCAVWSVLFCVAAAGILLPWSGVIEQNAIRERVDSLASGGPVPEMWETEACQGWIVRRHHECRRNVEIPEQGG